ncbi:MAG: VPLPA-CTERM sorting domain-containing protein [Desulfamplus sp.]
MKKLTLFITVISVCLFIYIGNAVAASEPKIPVPDGYTLLKESTGLYSSTNINFSSFKWEKGSAAYIHQLIINNDGDKFYLQLNVDKDGSDPFSSNYTFTSKDNTIQFQTYVNAETGGYFWLIEDIKVTSSDKDYNDLWARIDTKNTTPTPVPAAVWLFGSGLVGLVGLRRHNRK